MCGSVGSSSRGRHRTLGVQEVSDTKHSHWVHWWHECCLTMSRVHPFGISLFIEKQKEVFPKVFAGWRELRTSGRLVCIAEGLVSWVRYFLEWGLPLPLFGVLHWILWGFMLLLLSHQSCPTLRPHRRQPTRLRRPWDSPGKNTGVGCHFFLQCMKVKSESEVAQSFRLFVTPWTTAYQGSSVHGIFPGRSTGVGCHCLLQWNFVASF